MITQNIDALEARLKQMKQPEFDAFAEASKTNPLVFPLVFQEGLKRKRLQADAQMRQAREGSPAKVNDQALAAIQQDADPADSGIAQLYAGDMNYADGGIVAFAGGGKPSVGSYEAQIRAEAERQGVDPDLMVRMFAAESAGNPNAVSPKKAAGLGQLMPDAAAEMGLSPEERFDPRKNIPASIGYFKKQLGAFGGDPEKAAAAYNWGPGALGKHLKKNPNEWKLGLPKETAKYLTSLLPMGSAQAAPAAPAAGLPTLAAAQAAPTVSPADDGTVYDPMTGVPIYQGTPTEYAESPGAIVKQFVRPVVKGVTKAAKAITSAPKTRAEIEEEAAANREPFSTGEYRGKSGDVEEDIGPAQAPAMKQPSNAAIIDAAKQATPGGVDTTDFTPEDWLTIGFSMLANKSPYFMEALGSSGLAMLAGRQARAKTALEQRKTATDIKTAEALARKYGAEAARYEAEDKPLAQMRRELAAAHLKLEADPLLKLDPVKLAAEKRRVAADILSYYPELADTIGSGAATGVAAPQGVKVTRIGP